MPQSHAPHHRGLNAAVPWYPNYSGKGRMLVQHYSIDRLYEEHDFEIEVPDSSAITAEATAQTEWLYSCLTKRQRAFADLLVQGYTRAEIADKLGISLQGVHQRILVMRERLVRKAHVQR